MSQPVVITLTFASLELAITAMAAVRAAEGKNDAPKVEAAGNGTAAQATSATGKAKDKTAETKPSAAPAPTAASATPPAASPSPGTSSGATREAMSAAVRAGAATHREAVLGVLGKYGAKSAKDVPDDKIAEFMALLEAALKPVEDLGG